MNAKKAVELGFADEILFADGKPETEETEGDEDNGEEIEAAWQPYSTRIMGQTILNRLVCTAETPAVGTDEKPDEAPDAETAVEPAEAGVSDMFEEAIGENPQETADKPAEAPPDATEATQEAETEMAEDTAPRAPVIGMDGKTEDGGMPYELLKKQLDFLK